MPLVDDAFDLSAVNLADLPFGAYYNAEEIVLPVLPGRPARGGYLQVFPPHRRRRRPLLHHTHVAAGGVAVGGEADVLIINPRAADMAQARREDDEFLLDLGIL